MGSDCDDVRAPGINYHLFNANFPDIYIIFWAVGGTAALFCVLTIVPHIRRIIASAEVAKRRRGTLLVPYTYKLCLLMLSFPLIVTIANFISLLNPASAPSNKFVDDLLRAVSLYSLHIFVLHLLGPEHTIEGLFETSPETKYWASPPFACCCKSCCPALQFNSRDYFRAKFLITQYAVLAPVLGFASVYYTSDESDNAAVRRAVMIISIVKTISAMSCMYAMNILGTAFVAMAQKEANDANSMNSINNTQNTTTNESGLSGQTGRTDNDRTSLIDGGGNNSGYNMDMDGKFKCLRYSILSVVIPSAIFNSAPIVGGINDRYDKDVMVAVWSQFITLVLQSLLSVLFVRHFRPEDCEHALENVTKYYIHAHSLMNNRQGIDKQTTLSVKYDES